MKVRDGGKERGAKSEGRESSLGCVGELEESVSKFLGEGGEKYVWSFCILRGWEMNGPESNQERKGEEKEKGGERKKMKSGLEGSRKEGGERGGMVMGRWEKEKVSFFFKQSYHGQRSSVYRVGKWSLGPEISAIEDFRMDRLARLYLNEIIARHGVPIQSYLTVIVALHQGPEIVQETTENILQINDRLKTVRDRQKSHADKRRNPLEFSVGDHVLLKVSPWKGVIHFRKKGKLAPRFVGPFEITERISLVAYRLRLPRELNGVHDTLHVSNLKKCLADPTLQIPLEEIQVDAKLNLVEEPVEIL
ncbi:hypothetical protein Tco_0400072 [Tanacetum coccineum]